MKPGLVCFILFCSVVTFVVSACSSRLENKHTETVNPQGFPSSLAGTWKAEAGNWQITLDPDGKIISAVTQAGMHLPIAEGRLYQDMPQKDEFGLMEFGPGLVEYNPSIRQLKIQIEIKHILMEASNNSLEGSASYNFAGNISDDMSLWYAKSWMVLSLGGISLDPNDIVYESFVFGKAQ